MGGPSHFPVSSVGAERVRCNLTIRSRAGGSRYADVSLLKKELAYAWKVRG